jgi:hypothetical protein
MITVRREQVTESGGRGHGFWKLLAAARRISDAEQVTDFGRRGGEGGNGYRTLWRSRILDGRHAGGAYCGVDAGSVAVPAAVLSG